MSRKGNCYDNGPIESFFHTLKTEFVHHRHYATRAEAKRDIFVYIETFYPSIIELVVSPPSALSARLRSS